MRGITLGVMSQSKGMSHDGFLDLFSGATIAYGLRKLSKNYAGKCVRVRRSSDNQQTDIGFQGENIDSVHLLNFLNGTTGFVSVLYDQSGNAWNASQSDLTRQPSISISGGEAVMNFDGVDDFLISAPLPSIPTNDSGFFVSSVILPTLYSFRISQYNSSDNKRVWGVNTLGANNIVFTSGVQQTNIYSTAISASVTRIIGVKNHHIGAWGGGGTHNKASINASNFTLSSEVLGSITSVSQSVEIGSTNNGALLMPGGFYESIMYPFDLSSQKLSIESNINNFYKIWH